MSLQLKIPVYIEVETSRECLLETKEIIERVKSLLAESCPVFKPGKINIGSHLAGIVQEIRVDNIQSHQSVSFWQADMFINVFHYSDQEPENDFLEGEDEALPVAEQLELPNIYLKGLWESIIIDEQIKHRLFNFCCTSLLFAFANIDSNIISWNKMILLYGPPGTGKTSLCKALAQKVFIRNNQHFQTGLLFEINCHSLFSKWFSESGKLVMKLFTHISEIAEDEECLVVLLIDEVESIASARNAAGRSNEPSDAIRVVNAVLTSLDRLRRRRNVLVFCTSNMISSLDEAFLDRLDFKVYLGEPNFHARFDILLTCFLELSSKGIISHDPTFFLTLQQPSLASLSCESNELEFSNDQMLIEYLLHKYEHISFDSHIRDHPIKLFYELLLQTKGLSGRALRKLPIKAHALFFTTQQIEIKDYLLAMIKILSLDQTTI